MSKKVVIILSILVVLIVAGMVSKVVYDRVYSNQVNEAIKDLGLNPDDYDLEGVEADKIRDEVIRQTIEKELQKMGIAIEDVDLSGIDFSGLSYEEIYDVVSQRVLEKEIAASPPPAATAAPEVKMCVAAKKLPREFNGEPYYAGPLFDAHIHVPVSSGIVSTTAKQFGFEDMPAFGGDLSVDYLSCLFTGEGIGGAFGFFLTTKFSLDQEVQAAKTFKQAYSGLAPFFMPAPFDQLRVNSDSVKSTLGAQKGLFEGIGELKIFDGTNMDNPHFADMYAIANDGGLVVMMHPFADQKTVVENILTKYPNVKFLLHGLEREPWLIELIQNHSNVYYSLDANLTRLFGWEAHHVQKGPTKEEYVAYMRQNFNAVLVKEVGQWKKYIEQYPSRFLWGTDRWYGWHFDAEVGALLEEFGRSFIGKLDPAVQEAFAYKNAESLLGR